MECCSSSEGTMMERYRNRKEGTKKLILTAVLCVIWYVVSLFKALLAKYISTLFKKPLTLSFVQLVSISIYSIPLLYFCKLKFNPLSRYYFIRFLIPLSILKAITTASGHLAIWNISVSYSQIMRASMPVFTALFCWIILRTTLSVRSYLTLIPIVLGVGITTVTEADFSLFGMFCGMLATSGSSLQTIYNKILMDKSRIHSFQLTALLGWVSTALFFFVWFSADGLELLHLKNTIDVNSNSTAPSTWEWDWQVSGLLAVDGFTNFIQNVVAFAVLFLISPTSYAVGNISKRPVIIAVSIAVFKNTVSVYNVVGIVITVIGASLYTYFELQEDISKPNSAIEQHSENSVLDKTSSKQYLASDSENSKTV